ncbi:mitotic-spindle organizing gamma-tubulin ring associated-domain-containing protein [Lactarius pseudohatsudake]|nr:mitotic-spindle organizing gamma-tubulin ring associated-domain-containing protein [Lactarius pseudohatsudake]
MAPREADRIIPSAQQTLDILYDISQLLGTQLDKETLATCIGMIESGVNPEALAAVIQELRREGAAIAAAKTNAVDASRRAA